MVLTIVPFLTTGSTLALAASAWLVAGAGVFLVVLASAGAASMEVAIKAAAILRNMQVVLSISPSFDGISGSVPCRS